MAGLSLVQAGCSVDYSKKTFGDKGGSQPALANNPVTVSEITPESASGGGTGEGTGNVIDPSILPPHGEPFRSKETRVEYRCQSAGEKGNIHCLF